jgi:hypothetical protein
VEGLGTEEAGVSRQQKSWREIPPGWGAKRFVRPCWKEPPGKTGLAAVASVMDQAMGLTCQSRQDRVCAWHFCHKVVALSLPEIYVY